MEEHKDFVDKIITEQRNDLEEICKCFDSMAKQGLYKEMLPILRMIEETAPEIYQAYYKKAEMGAEYKRKINEVY